MYDDQDDDVVVIRRYAPDGTHEDIPLPADAPPLTAAAERERGYALGLQGEALDVFVRAGASLRHEHRIKLAQDAIRAFAGSTAVQGDGTTTPEQRISAAAAVLYTLDTCGVGGHHGTGMDGGTTRHPAFAGLGKGRKQATDGAAWTAAIEAAARLLQDGPWEIAPAVRGAEVGLYARAVRGEERPQVWVTLEGAWPLWVEALARRVVHCTARGEQTGLLGIGGNVEQWGDLLNLAHAAVQAVESAAAITVPVYTADAGASDRW